jgi:hypothetical protein
MKVTSAKELADLRAKAQRPLVLQPRVSLGMGTCGLGNGAGELCDALIAAGARVKRPAASASARPSPWPCST